MSFAGTGSSPWTRRSTVMLSPHNLAISMLEDRKWWMVLYLIGWAVFYPFIRFASKNKMK